MEFYYVNSINKKINFISEDYKAQSADMFNYEWEYTSKDNRIKTLGRKITTKKLVITVSAKNMEDYYRLLNTLVDIIDYDNYRKVKGRLYVNDYYIECNVIASEKKDWEYGNAELDNALKILAENSSWTKEEVFNYYPTQVSQEGSKKYTYQYPFAYGSEGGRSTIRNDSINDSDLLIRVYGPVSNPLISLDSNIYQVMYTVEELERIEISTSTRKILLIKSDGTKISIFNSRNRVGGVFKSLKSGISDVVWNNSFKFDVVVHERRSEPKWR